MKLLRLFSAPLFYFLLAFLIWLHQYIVWGIIWEWNEVLGLHHELFIVGCLAIGSILAVFKKNII